MYEQYTTTLSRLLVESLISPTYRETIKTRFSTCDNYDDLPGQVYFVMVLEACNAADAIDGKTAKGNFEASCLINFPGKNIS